MKSAFARGKFQTNFRGALRRSLGWRKNARKSALLACAADPQPGGSAHEGNDARRLAHLSKPHVHAEFRPRVRVRGEEPPPSGTVRKREYPGDAPDHAIGFVSSPLLKTSPPLNKMPRPRLELKHRVNEATARAVRDYVGAFLELDRYVTDRVSLSYPVDSVYLDSDALTTFWSTVHAQKCRYKLRARTYSDAPDAPVFLEIKRRINGYIVKDRAPVLREAVAELLSGRMPTADDMASADPADLLAAEKFVQLMHEIEATPRARVRYQREAWVDPMTPGLRLTFDRDVEVTPAFTTSLERTPLENPARPFGDVVILEMKFSGAAPHWFRDLRQIGGLQRTSAAKYCDGVLTRGIDHFNPTSSVACDAAGHDRMETRLRRHAAPLAAAYPAAAPSFA